MEDILINWSPQETRVAVVENGAVQELHIERTLERGLVGNVYLGKVVRVLPGMQSAFIDIGLERAAFLHVADLHSASQFGHGRNHNADAPPTPIERLVFEGQPLTVQVIKDPIGTKGARLSSQISIAGRMLVYLPQDEHIGISQKIGSPEAREALRARMAALVGTKEQGGGGGFILRTNAEDASDEELAADIAYLRKTWQQIREKALTTPPASLLHQDLSLVERVLRDLASERTGAIRIDSRMQYDVLRQFGETFMPAATAKLEHYRGERPIFDLCNVDAEIARALARKVELKSGGSLVFDQTEAMTTIDVNTGGFVAVAGDDEGGRAVGHGQHGLQAAQHAVGAPVARQLDGGAHQMALVLLQLGLEALEQREGIGRRAGEARQHLLAVELAHLARAGLDDGVAQRDLAVAADGDLPAGGRLPAHRDDGGAVVDGGRGIRGHGRSSCGPARVSQGQGLLALRKRAAAVALTDPS